ncbi:glycerol-3-phosphate dehydrogenase, putative [Theileria equi strain WA]|uniref:glycerol-3-phosphate dehydrogenase n=1 Tax=Theileria equi strain WA TaxID=1537102 RepID=L1LD33_THEEQ|nr:glycerol-3-phosphate dehydrogenase, putative [Theileria equi strain WA]EKX73189.1 glycerol-3-phosphate dehydrogenase, putative [Theileria equi strain WA]|eukprot:XP_004832641.1 glycerol-3-phosphate dehydrogenase, putative [Theileria equi strain WA]
MGRKCRNLIGICSGAIAGSYLFVKREHEKCSLPRDTKFIIPDKLKSRSDMIKSLKSDKFDVLVIGGGCTGTSVALDCATRGLKCALVEANDFSSGTTSKSTKLLHGGIRYLESALLHLDLKELQFVWKALEERAHLIGTAPFANSPVPIVMPIYQLWQLPYFWINIKIYEVLARFFCCNETRIPSSFFSGKSNAVFNFPGIRPDGLLGAVVYYDGQHNDSRTNVLMALTSTIDEYVPGQVGSTIGNYLKVEELLKDSTGKVNGALVCDVLTGETFTVKADVVVNCAGPFAEKIKKLSLPESKLNILHSRGTHVTLPAKYCPTPYGLIIPKTSDGRVLFILPWQGNTIVGTTDNKDELQANPLPQVQDVDFICKDASKYMNCDASQIKADIKSTWSGLRPLLKGVDEVNQTGKLSRGHVIEVDESGLVNVYGGKWTICRLMAQECVDKVVKHFPSVTKGSYACRTRNMVLLGTHNKEGVSDIDDIKPRFNRLSSVITEKYGLDSTVSNHLVESYGYKALDVCELSKEMGLLKPIHEEHPYIMGEVVYGIRNEMACKPIDILARRTRLAFKDVHAAVSSLGLVCDLMGKELSWSAETREQLHKEATAYLKDMMVPS